LKAELIEHGAEHAMMTGTGSTVFGLFRVRADAEAAAREVAGPAIVVQRARLVPRAEYQERALGR
jgi:4-diphosphocytidyl-2C-methyl-D-erythritol kinase